MVDENLYKAPESSTEEIRKPVLSDVKTPKAIYWVAFFIFFYLGSQSSVLRHALGADSPAAPGSAVGAILILYMLAIFLLPFGVAKLNKPALILAALITGISAVLMVVKMGVAIYSGEVSRLLWVTLVMTGLLAISAWVCIRPSTQQASSARAAFKKQQAMVSYVSKSLTRR